MVLCTNGLRVDWDSPPLKLSQCRCFPVLHMAKMTTCFGPLSMISLASHPGSLKRLALISSSKCSKSHLSTPRAIASLLSTARSMSHHPGGVKDCFEIHLFEPGWSGEFPCRSLGWLGFAVFVCITPTEESSLYINPPLKTPFHLVASLVTCLLIISCRYHPESLFTTYTST